MSASGAGPPPGEISVAIYTGIVVDSDAISNSLTLKLDVLSDWGAAGAAVSAPLHRSAG